MAVVQQPFDSNHEFHRVQIDANTLFGGGERPYSAVPQDAIADAITDAQPDHFENIDELVDYSFDEIPHQPEVDQTKPGFLDRARTIRAHLSGAAHRTGEVLHAAGYRTGEALLVAKMDLPARHEHANIKEATKATVKSVKSSSANIVSQAVLQNRAGDVLRATRTDYQESDNKIRALSLGAAVVATEALDRARLMIFVVPKVATDVLNNTHSPVQGAIAGAAAYTAWNLGTSWVLSHGLNQFPKGKEAIKEKFPAAVSFFKDALPGANKEVAEAKRARAEEKGVPARVRSFLGRHAMRGLAGINLGTTAFVATSSINGDTMKETRKEYVGVSIDTAAITGIVIAGVGQFIFEGPKHGMAAQSEWLYNGVTNMRFWGAVALASMGLAYNDSRLYKKKLALREAEAENEPVILDEEVAQHQYLINQKNAVEAAQ